MLFITLDRTTEFSVWDFLFYFSVQNTHSRYSSNTGSDLQKNCIVQTCAMTFTDCAAVICVYSVTDLLRQPLITQSGPGLNLGLASRMHYASEGELTGTVQQWDFVWDHEAHKRNNNMVIFITKHVFWPPEKNYKYSLKWLINGLQIIFKTLGHCLRRIPP